MQPLSRKLPAASIRGDAEIETQNVLKLTKLKQSGSTREGYACITVLDKNASHDDDNDDEYGHYDDDARIEDSNDRDADIKINRTESLTSTLAIQKK